MTFDPNVAPETTHLWGTYRPGHSKNRQPWKTHASLTTVRSAIDARGYSPITVYYRETVESEWVEVFSLNRPPQLFPPESHVCCACGEEFSSSRRVWLKWSPSEPFSKVRVHFGSCERRVKGAPEFALPEAE